MFKAPQQAFLKRIRGMYPTGGAQSELSNPWYIIAAAVYNASNKPDGVPFIFNHVWTKMKEQGESIENQRLLARKIREAVLKAGMLSGYSKAINSLIALDKAMPSSFRDSRPLRDFNNTSFERYHQTGTSLFTSFYGKNAEQTQELLYSAYPDLGTLITTITYGFVYGQTKILSPVETSYAILATLIAEDTPLQVGWHLNGAQRLGASFEGVKAARGIAIEVLRSVASGRFEGRGGRDWEGRVPEVVKLEAEKLGA